jgi:integrase
VPARPKPNSCLPKVAASPYRKESALTRRHTFASVLIAIGKHPAYVMHQLGHTDPAFTLRVYAHVMRRSPQERERLKPLVEGHDRTPSTNVGANEAERP